MDNVTAHLRRSFSIFNIVAAIFFIIYLWQAYALYQRSNDATLHTRTAINWLLNLKNVDVDNAKLKLSAKDLVATPGLYDDEVKQNIKKLNEDIAIQDTLVAPNATQKKDFQKVTALIANKIAILDQLINSKGENNAASIETREAMTHVSKNIDATFDIMEHTANADFRIEAGQIQRTE